MRIRLPTTQTALSAAASTASPRRGAGRLAFQSSAAANDVLLLPHGQDATEDAQFPAR